MSYVERTAKKLLPILTEVKKRMIPDKKRKGSKSGEEKDSNQNRKGSNVKDEGSGSEDDEDLVIDLSKIKGNKN